MFDLGTTEIFYVYIIPDNGVDHVRMIADDLETIDEARKLAESLKIAATQIVRETIVRIKVA